MLSQAVARTESQRELKWTGQPMWGDDLRLLQMQLFHNLNPISKGGMQI
jgi:hypothetical protein